MVFQVFSNVAIFIKNRKAEKRLNEVEKEKTEDGKNGTKNIFKEGEESWLTEP